VLQLLNLTCVLGFMTSPLLVKPFLYTTAHDDAATNNATRSLAAHCSSRNTTTNSTAVTSACDVSVTSHYAVTHVFVIVAVYSLLVGLLMLALFIKDYLTHRRQRQRSGGMMQMRRADEEETEDRVCPTSENTVSQCEFDVTITVTQTDVREHRVTV